MKRFQRRTLSLALGIALLAIYGSQPQPTNAARAVVVLADDNRAWSTGSFFRTGLALDAPSGPGGVQLVPVKVQKQYQPTSALPIPLSSHSSVAFRNRIFVLGGDTLESGILVKSKKVFSARRLPGNDNGQLTTWEELTALPVALANASTVVTTIGTQPYLISFGGMKGRTSASSSEELTSVTTNRIYYSALNIDSNGVLTSPLNWREAVRHLPHNPNFEDGTDPDLLGGGASGMGTVVATIGSQPYVYLFGGMNRSSVLSNKSNTYFSNIFRATLSVSGGNLVVGVWDWDINNSTGPAVHIPASTTYTSGTPLAGAVTTSFTDPVSGDTGVYLVGGENDDSTRDANAYVVKINGSTGQVTSGTTGNMNAIRSAHAGVQSDGLITLTGGTDESNNLTSTAALGYIMDNLELYHDPVNPNLANFDTASGGLNYARSNHRMETLDGGLYHDYAYIMGGVAPNGSSLL